MEFDIKIYGVHARDNFIDNYRKKLDLTDKDIYYDDRPNGGDCLYTCKKAWLAPMPANITHRLCMPDDLDICPNFKIYIQKIIEHFPDAVIGLFPYSTVYPYEEVETFTGPYIKANYVTGCGTIIPVKYIKQCFDDIDSYWSKKYPFLTEDMLISTWCEANNIQMITTIPSTVQHLGDYSVLFKTKNKIITPYFKDWDKYDWDCNILNEFKTKDVYKKHKDWSALWK